jgi:hypothetical protein
MRLIHSYLIPGEDQGQKKVARTGSTGRRRSSRCTGDTELEDDEEEDKEEGLVYNNIDSEVDKFAYIHTFFICIYICTLKFLYVYSYLDTCVYICDKQPNSFP